MEKTIQVASTEIAQRGNEICGSNQSAGLITVVEKRAWIE